MHEEIVRRTLADLGQLTTPVETLGPDDDLYVAGLTSHATVNVMLGLEDELGFEFPPELLRRSTFESIGALTRAVETALGSVNSALDS